MTILRIAILLTVVLECSSSRGFGQAYYEITQDIHPGTAEVSKIWIFHGFTIKREVKTVHDILLSGVTFHSLKYTYLFGDNDIKYGYPWLIPEKGERTSIQTASYYQDNSTAIMQTANFFDFPNSITLNESQFNYVSGELLLAQFIKMVNFTSIQSSIKRLHILNNSKCNVSLSNDSVSDILIQDCDSMQLSFTNCVLPRIHFSNVKSITSIDFSGSALPDTIAFENLTLSPALEHIDLTQFLFRPDHPCVLRMDGQEITRLKFDYYYFSLDTSFAGLADRSSRIAEAYKRILDIQRNYGFADGLQKADAEYQHYMNLRDGTRFGWLKDWVVAHWQFYGYRKELIFRNTAYAFLLCFFINLFAYRCLLYKVYQLPSFISADRALKHKYGKRWYFIAFFSFFHCLFYTGFLFFGLKLDTTNLKVARILGTFWLLLQYSAGIVCLAYLAGYVLNK